MSFGLDTKALATAMRWRCPPLNLKLFRISDPSSRLRTGFVLRIFFVPEAKLT
jgi:hypothetical protein